MRIPTEPSSRVGQKTQGLGIGCQLKLPSLGWGQGFINEWTKQVYFLYQVDIHAQMTASNNY